MSQPLIDRLQEAWPLTSDDREALRTTFSRQVETRRCGAIMHEGQAPVMITAVLEGMAFRYKTLPNGTRQIVSIVVPGDICDLSSLFFERLDYGILAAVDCEIAVARKEAVLHLINLHPNISRALWISTLADAALLQEWVVNVGRRSAHQRVAHLLCELFLRTRSTRFSGSEACVMPLTQEKLADATGLSSVRVNRVLQDLRAERLFTLDERILTILDWTRMCATAGFSGTYLHRAQGAASLT